MESDTTPAQLVPDPAVAREFQISLMTLSRWSKDPRMLELGWPPAVKIRGRNFRPRRGLEQFKINAARASRAA